MNLLPRITYLRDRPHYKDSFINGNINDCYREVYYKNGSILKTCFIKNNKRYGISQRWLLTGKRYVILTFSDKNTVETTHGISIFFNR